MSNGKSPAIEDPSQQTDEEMGIKLSRALRYMDKVKAQFEDEPDKYGAFMDIIRKDPVS